MRTLFLTHEQRLLYFQEPGYTEIILPMVESGLVPEHLIYNYQREWRWILSQPYLASDDPSLQRERAMELQFILISQAIKDFRPELVVYIATWPSEAIRSTILARLKTVHGIKLCSIISDHMEDSIDSQTHDRFTIAVSDLTVILDSKSRVDRIKLQDGIYSNFINTERVIFMPAFPPRSVFRPSNEKRYDVTLSGSLEGVRGEIASNLLQRGLRLHLSGGILDPLRHLPLTQYAADIASSRLLINTQTIPNRVQMKGRVAQALACGALLLEQENPETRLYLDGIDIDYWSSIDDLMLLIDFYLANEESRHLRAQQLHSLWNERHSAEKFTQTIFDGVR